MEIMRGKRTSFIDASALAERLYRYDSVHIDIGTGDGRFVRHMAQANPNCLAIGIDACRENLHEVSRRTGENALFVIANAQSLPVELYGLAGKVTINFPWGSLLEDLLADDVRLLAGLVAVTQPKTSLEVRLNAGALTESGWSLEEGANRIQIVLAATGFMVHPAVTMTAEDLKSLPTTWAKRLAFGRDARAMFLHGVRKADIIAAATSEANQGYNLLSA